MIIRFKIVLLRSIARKNFKLILNNKTEYVLYVIQFVISWTLDTFSRNPSIYLSFYIQNTKGILPWSKELNFEFVTS